MSKAGQQILFIEHKGEKYVRLRDYLSLASELTDLQPSDQEATERLSKAQMRDFLLTTYTEYLDWHDITEPAPTFDGYIKYLRSL